MLDSYLHKPSPETADSSTLRRELLWQKLEASIVGQIASGVLEPGDRMPSVREMSRTARVSVSTVVQTYLQLEAQGFIHSRPRSGFFVAPRHDTTADPEVIELPDSQPTAVASDVVLQIFESLRQEGMVPFGAATLSPDFLPVGPLQRITSRLLRERAEEILEYRFPPGEPELRKQIAKRLSVLGAKVAAEDVLITSGGMEALSLSLHLLCRAGDTVLVESPTYFGILQCIDGLGLRVLEIPNGTSSGIDPDDVRQAIRRTRIKAALLVPNFNNPAGSLTTNEAKKAVVDILTEANVPIIEDDIYGELVHGTARPAPMKTFDQAGLVLTCSSISKVAAPGFRIGWVVSQRFRQALRQEKLRSTLATSTLQQLAIAEFMKNGFERHIRGLRKALAQQVQVFSDAILAHFPAGTRVSRPRGGYVLWVELPGKVAALDLMREAFAHRISISPGPIFSATGAYSNFIRINCGVAWSPAATRAVRALGHMVHARLR